VCWLFRWVQARVSELIDRFQVDLMWRNFEFGPWTGRLAPGSRSMSAPVSGQQGFQKKVQPKSKRKPADSESAPATSMPAGASSTPRTGAGRLLQCFASLQLVIALALQVRFDLTPHFEYGTDIQISVRLAPLQKSGCAPSSKASSTAAQKVYVGLLCSRA
jgi:hypothetical protein